MEARQHGQRGAPASRKSCAKTCAWPSGCHAGPDDSARELRRAAGGRSERRGERDPHGRGRSRAGSRRKRRAGRKSCVAPIPDAGSVTSLSAVSSARDCPSTTGPGTAACRAPPDTAGTAAAFRRSPGQRRPWGPGTRSRHRTRNRDLQMVGRAAASRRSRRRWRGPPTARLPAMRGSPACRRWKIGFAAVSWPSRVDPRWGANAQTVTRRTGGVNKKMAAPPKAGRRVPFNFSPHPLDLKRTKRMERTKRAGPKVVFRSAKERPFAERKATNSTPSKKLGDHDQGAFATHW